MKTSFQFLMKELASIPCARLFWLLPESLVSNSSGWGLAFASFSGFTLNKAAVLMMLQALLQLLSLAFILQ